MSGHCFFMCWLLICFFIGLFYFILKFIFLLNILSQIHSINWYMYQIPTTSKKDKRSLRPHQFDFLVAGFARTWLRAFQKIILKNKSRTWKFEFRFPLHFWLFYFFLLVMIALFNIDHTKHFLVDYKQVLQVNNASMCG